MSPSPIFKKVLDETMVTRDFGISSLSLKTVATNYALALALFIPISSWMTDRYDKLTDEIAPQLS